MDREELIVGGYMFQDYREAQIATRELKNVEMIRSKTDYNNKDSMLEVYNKLIERKFFKTIVGYEFLSELRHALIEDGYCMDDELVPIAVKQVITRGPDNTAKIEKLEEDIEKATSLRKKMIIALIALSVLVVGMFFVAATNKNVGYINTENKILDKYAGWEEELQEREKAIQTKEEELGIDTNKND